GKRSIEVLYWCDGISRPRVVVSVSHSNGEPRRVVRIGNNKMRWLYCNRCFLRGSHSRLPCDLWFVVHRIYGDLKGERCAVQLSVVHADVDRQRAIEVECGRYCVAGECVVRTSRYVQRKSNRIRVV